MRDRQISKKAIYMTASLTVENVFQQEAPMLRKQLFNKHLAHAISMEESECEVLQCVDKFA